MKTRYTMFAAYNAWANERLYDAAAQLSDADYRADRGAFFKSVHGTLNHLLIGDRIWMRRFTGTEPCAGPARRDPARGVRRTCATPGAPRTRASRIGSQA